MRDVGAICVTAIAVALAFAVAPRLLAQGPEFDAMSPPQELRLCRDYGRSADHAFPLPAAPVIDPGSAELDAIGRSAIGEPGCPFVFEVRLRPDRFVQYTGRGGP